MNSPWLPVTNSVPLLQEDGSPIPSPLSMLPTPRGRSGSIELPSMEELEELGIDLGQWQSFLNAGSKAMQLNVVIICIGVRQIASIMKPHIYRRYNCFSFFYFYFFLGGGGFNNSKILFLMPTTFTYIILFSLFILILYVADNPYIEALPRILGVKRIGPRLREFMRKASRFIHSSEVTSLYRIDVLMM